jgi:uridine kinase
MRGDKIIVEPHHRDAAKAILPIILPNLEATEGKYTLAVAGESGSGKSETATAIAELLAAQSVPSVIFQQDDYFVHPPKTNDRVRRRDIGWVGPQEVRLDLLDAHLRDFLQGAASIEKPLAIYEEDRFTTETAAMAEARVAIAEGTYTTLLSHANTKIFIDRDYLDTRAHREKRKRDVSELDPFIDEVLRIEHAIISAHRSRADIIINKDYSVRTAG